MDIPDYKAEENKLIGLFYDRVSLLHEDKEMGFNDGMRVQLFASELITWFRYSKTLSSGGNITRGQQVSYDICQEINLGYGFNFTVENIQEQTYYTKETIDVQ